MRRDRLLARETKKASAEQAMIGITNAQFVSKHSESPGGFILPVPRVLAVETEGKKNRSEAP